MDAAFMSKTSSALSDAMLSAGFKSSNAAMQSGVAMVIEDVFEKVVVKGDFCKIFVFGSFSDGWGSCLRRIDGNIDSDSDIDITLIPNVRPIHLSNQLRSCGCSEDSRSVEYNDGHVKLNIPWNFGTPCAPISGSSMLELNIDAIISLPCCNYPDIEILKPGYQSHIAPHILDALNQEFRFPRCHAVAAAPPGQQEFRHFRVSTTMLEKIMMRNLTTIQGQFFILLKFIIKKVVNAKVQGLKTYAAKNLLFYMLDETPADEWRSDNLLAVVPQALQMLISMMESEETGCSEFVAASCMKHFFLRDASVYFKEKRDERFKIVNAVRDVCLNLDQHIQQFQATLPSAYANVVNFDILMNFLVSFYLIENNYQYNGLMHNWFPVMIEICLAMLRETPLSAESDSFNQLLNRINQIQELPDFLKESVRIMAHHNIGAPVGSTDQELYGKTFSGVLCPTGDTELTVKSAKEIVLKVLKSNPVLGIQVSDGSVESISFSNQMLPTIFLSAFSVMRPDGSNVFDVLFNIFDLLRHLKQSWWDVSKN